MIRKYGYFKIGFPRTESAVNFPNNNGQASMVKTFEKKNEELCCAFMS